jgi:predicted Rossmann fold nucleotide-binding protein DprA/Smf involved in DNA uptake
MANAPALPNAPGSNGAAKRIQADGYKNVEGLVRGTDGKWHGTAMRGNTKVGVIVDGRGNVSSQ